MQLRVEDGEAPCAPARASTGRRSSRRSPQAAGLPDGIIDGEVVALDHDGAPDFAALQAALSEGETESLVFFAFDLLFAEGEDLRALPLRERKARLEALLDGLKGKHPALRYVEHFETAGDAVLQSACRMSLEGIVSKQLDAPYRSGRGGTWLKSKCRAGHEVVIGGWTTTGQSSARCWWASIAARSWSMSAGSAPASARRRRAAPAAAARGREQDQPVRRRRQPAQGSACTGRSPSWWPRSSSPASPATAWCGRPPSRACATTSPPTR